MNLKVDYIMQPDWLDNAPLKPKGIMVHSTATPGVMAQQFRDSWDRPNTPASIHAFLDDKEIIQCMAWDKQAGHSGGSANQTHLSFEICEPGGFYYSGGANMVGYDVVRQMPYFNAIYKNAVEFCSYLCKMFNLDPLADGVVICHSEGYQRGIASNHADVMHWFPYHGKTMDAFRRDVKKEMEEDDMTQEQFNEMYEMINPIIKDLKDVPPYWQDEVKALLASGAIDGGTTAEENPTDINMRIETLKAAIIATRYFNAREETK